jgi:hypothetical protein
MRLEPEGRTLAQKVSSPLRPGFTRKLTIGLCEKGEIELAIRGNIELPVDLACVCDSRTKVRGIR